VFGAGRAAELDHSAAEGLPVADAGKSDGFADDDARGRPLSLAEAQHSD